MRNAIVAAALGAVSMISAAGAYSGEDVLYGAPFHHYDITYRALAGDAAVTGDAQSAIFPGLGFSRNAAVAIAWHADYIDSYLYSPIWWAQGVTENNPTQRIKAAFSQYDHLVKLHFDDTFTPGGVNDTWRRYGAGTIAALAFAAQTNDVAAAYNILGVSSHAVQDFYSHSNWVDEPSRRAASWLETSPEARRALSIYTGAYEMPRSTAQKHHGKVSFECSIYGRPELKSVLDTICTGLTPFAEMPFCITQRHCGSNVTSAISVAGAELSHALVLDPPGIALDSTWLARADGPQRGLTDKGGNFTKGADANMPSLEMCTRIANFGWECDAMTGACKKSGAKACTSDSDRLFAASKFLAIEATTEWIDKIDQIMMARYPDFWRNVRAGSVNGADKTSVGERIAQYEDFSKVPFQFLSAGPYPVNNNQAGGRSFEPSADGYYLRLRINTANKTNAGVDTDIKAIVDYPGGSKEFRLDYMPTDDASAGLRANRLVAYNDFEQGDDTVYTVGPTPSMPTALTLFNDSADAAEVFDALGDDIASAIDDFVAGLEEAALGIISGNADYTGNGTEELTFKQLTRTTLLQEIEIDGAADGKYKLTFDTSVDTGGGLTQSQIAAGWRHFTIRLDMLFATQESEWDRSSDSDEPFFFFAATPLNGSADATQYWNIGPLEDVDTGEFREINQSRSFILPPQGVAIFTMSLYESDDESAAARQSLFEQFKTGIEGGADPVNKKFLDALGRAVASDWEISRVRATAFYRGQKVEIGNVLDQSGDVVIAGDARQRFALNAGAMIRIIGTGESPDNWVAAKRFAVGGPAVGGTVAAAPPSAQPGATQPAAAPAAPPAAPFKLSTPTYVDHEIVAQHSQKCVDVSGVSKDDAAPVHQWTCIGGANQKWSLHPIGNGAFAIVAKHSGKCLDVSGLSMDDGGAVVQYACHGGANQQWRLKQMGANFQIVAAHSGKCLDVRGPSVDDGAILHQWTCLGPQQTNQIFALRGPQTPQAAQPSTQQPAPQPAQQPALAPTATPQTDAAAGRNAMMAREIVAQHSQKCVDVSGVSQDDQAPVHQWTCIGGANQSWDFKPVGADAYMISARHSGKCLDVAGQSLADGAGVVQHECHGGPNQQWRLTPIGSNFQIVAAHSDKCLDVSGVSQDDGALMHQWACLGAQQTNQIFQIR